MKIFTSILAASLALILSFGQANAISKQALQKAVNTQTEKLLQQAEFQLGKATQYTVDNNQFAPANKFHVNNRKWSITNVHVRSYGMRVVGIYSYIKEGALKGTEILLTAAASSYNKLADTSVYGCYTNVDRILSSETGSARHNTESVFIKGCRYVHSVHSVIYSYNSYR